jgi:hypothetical protein
MAAHVTPDHQAHYEGILAAYDGLSAAVLAYLEGVDGEIASEQALAQPNQVLLHRLASVRQQLGVFDDLLTTEVLEALMGLKRTLFTIRMAREGKLL